MIERCDDCDSLFEPDGETNYLGAADPKNQTCRYDTAIVAYCGKCLPKHPEVANDSAAA